MRIGKYIILFVFNASVLFAAGIDSLKEYIVCDKTGDAVFVVEIKNLVINKQEFHLLLDNKFLGITAVYPSEIISCDTASINGKLYLRLKMDSSYVKIDSAVIKYSVKSFLDFENQKVLDFGNRILSFRFQNISEYLIKNYECSISFPEGYLVNKVIDLEPALKDTATFKQCELKNNGVLHTIILRSEELKPYESTSIKCSYKTGFKSKILIIIIIIIALFYLIFFRNILKPYKKDQNQ